MPEHIIERLKAGEEAAFRELVDTQQQRILNVALGLVQSHELAEDITQEVFIEVFRSVGKFSGQSTLSTWIYRITVNKCLDALRYQKRGKRFAFITSLFRPDTGELKYESAHFDHPGVALEKKENARMLFAAIDELPENQKVAFILSQVEEVPQKDIALIMNISIKAVESLIQRAKSNLRKKLENIYIKRRKHDS
ncbi:MAG: RNA polymerase subunit sigma-70 [Bacteroidetes bacterium 46-16]|nr:MAG: RNA polymerase subunit sigma-70 [Bacteroidetes bacterium 46-16]